MLRFVHVAVSTALLALAPIVLASSALASVRKSGPPTNEQGMPVKDESGGRITYSREELDARMAPPDVRTSERGSNAFEPPARAVGSEDSQQPPSGVTARWGYAAFGTGIGFSNIVLADGEILAGGGQLTFGANDYWYALRPLGGGYEQVFVSRSLPGLIGLAVGDVTGDARKEIVAACADGTVVLFDLRSRVELATLAMAASNVEGMALHDLDGDGKQEILLTTSGFYSNSLFVVSGSGALVWQLPAAGGSDVVVGNMDADASLEIATTSGVVVDWATRIVQWTRPAGFGIDLEVGDIDSDGMDELIGAESWSFVWAFDVDTQLPKWSIPLGDIDCIWLGNVDSDPTLELLVGEGQWGDVLAFDTVTMAQEWLIANPEHGVTSIAVGDPNRNGVRDVLWGSGATSSGSDRLYVANLSTRTIDWENVQLEGPFLPLQQGDVDGDGIPDLITASTSSDAGYDSGRIVILDSATLRVRAISPPVVANGSWEGVHDLRLRNVDADAALEVVIAADDTYDGVIEIYDIAASGTFTRIWTNTVQPDGSPFFTADVADVDADGQLEVVGGVGRAHTGSPGTFVYVYSLATGAQEWRSPFTLTTSWEPISGLALLTAGGGMGDIVAMVQGESLNFFTGAGQVQAITNGPYSFLGQDSTLSGRVFLTGDESGTVRQHQRQGSSYAVTWSRSMGPTTIVDGITLFPGGSMALVANGRLFFHPQRDGAIAWNSEDYGVRGSVVIGAGSNRRPLVGARYAALSLAPWLTLTSVQPPSGSAAGGTVITATGTAFDPAADLFVGGREAVGTVVASSTQASGTTPLLPMCASNTVTVVNPDMSYELLEDGFLSLRPGNNWHRCPR